MPKGVLSGLLTLLYYDFLIITARQYCFARCRLSASVIVVCSAAGVRAGRGDRRRAGNRARGRSGGRHCTASQYDYVPLGRHVVN